MYNKFLIVIKQISRSFWSLFKTGLITLLPLLLTIAIIMFVVKSVRSILYPLRSIIELGTPFIPSWIKDIPYIESVILILLLILIGKALNMLIFRSLVSKFEYWLDKIPFIRPIYSGMKQLVSTFGTHDQITIKEVVLVEITQGLYSIGFVTGQIPPLFEPQKNVPYENVFVPTTPNPTAGYFYLVEKSKLIPLNVSRKEAMAYIMSVGLIHPQSILEEK